MKQERIARAKELLKTVRHAAMATVNEDGSPHNTPYFFAHNADFSRLFWRSRSDTQHSKNIEHTGQLFVVLYTSAGKGDGLYFQAGNARQADAAELDEIIAQFNLARQAAAMPVVDPGIYKTAVPKFYVATVENIWINSADVDTNGIITRDYRVPITAADLLAEE